MSKTLLSIWQETLPTLSRGKLRVFTVHLAYVALGVMVFSPLVGMAGQFLLGLSGQSVLSDLDIAAFIFTLPGMLALTLFAALMITILVFEQTSLMVVCSAAARGMDVPLFPALRYTAERAKKIFSFAVRLVLRLLLLTLPFLAVCATIAWFLLTDYDINYYLAEKPPQFFAAAVAIALVLLIMTGLLVRRLFSWSLALPLILFTATSPAHSFRESAELTAGERKFFVLTLGSWLLMTIFLSTVILGMIQLLGSALAPFFIGSISWLIPMLGGLTLLWVLANLALTTFTSGSFSVLLLALYQHCGGDIQTEHFAAREPRTKQQLSGRKLAFLLTAGAITATLIGGFLLENIPGDSAAMVIAHRGAAGKAPENTMASLFQAMEDGADWIEIDVQESADGEVMVIHDSDFMKLAGVNLKVWDATLEEIQKIDIGSWFSPEFAAERVPTLKEVLQAARGRVRVLIELKYYGHDQQLEQRVAEIVEKTGMVKSVALMSLKAAGVKKFHNLRPSWPVGLLSTKAIGRIADLDVDFMAINMATATPAFIRRIHAIDKQVYVWTVNDQLSMSRMAALGVDGLITDEPSLAREVITERAKMTSVERLLLHTALLLSLPLPQRTYRDQSP